MYVLLLSGRCPGLTAGQGSGVGRVFSTLHLPPKPLFLGYPPKTPKIVKIPQNRGFLPEGAISVDFGP